MVIMEQLERVGNMLSDTENYLATQVLGGWNPAVIPDLTGKTALVTGANSGLGFETARKLAENGAKVFMVSRDLKNGQEAVQKIRAEIGKAARVEVLQCDMSILENVVTLAREFKQSSNSLDILVNMAGVFHPGPYAQTVDGIEQSLAINFYAHALLTLRLLDTLRSTHASRVVFMASPAESFGRLDWHNLKGEKFKDSGMVPYGTSKTFMLMFSHELATRVPEVDFLCVHPGLVMTPLQQKTSLRYWTAWLTTTAARFVGQTPHRGAYSTLYAATDPSLTGTHWGYYGPNNLNLWPTARREPAQAAVKNPVACWKLFEETVRVLHEAVGHRHPFAVPRHPDNHTPSKATTGMTGTTRQNVMHPMAA